MEHAVLLTKQPDNGYTARSLLLPEIVVSGDDEASTLAQLRTALIEVQQHSRVVQIDVPLPDATTSNPWLRLAGVFADDPSWEEFQAAIAIHRAQLDEPQA
ncbi:MAG: hypothetical protein KDD77_00515 [Caldilineaceae bacterium]|nr:hypothetical protein [Caldilinea sp.]MCB0065595.1 hypothetical protein [Caldilineaceae bacterium]